MARETDAIKLALSKPLFAEVNAEKDDKEYKSKMYSSLFYIHNVVDAKKLKKAALEYIGIHLPDIDAKEMNKLADGKFESVGKFCFLVLRGATLAPQHLDSIDSSLTKMAEKLHEKLTADPDDADSDEKPAKAKTVGIQDYMREKAEDTCSEFEAMFDEYCANPNKVKLDIDPKNILVNAGLKAGHLRYVVKFYEPMIAELTEALDGDDKELRDAYGFLTKPQLRKYIAYVQSIIDTAGFMKNANVSNRKPRKKKAIDVSKLAAKLKHIEEFEGVKSVNPVHIHGAKGVWVYNTRTRKLGYYEAFDEVGLTLKGTSIKNFSEKSVERTIRKGAAFNLKKFADTNKSTRKREYKELKSMEVKMKGRTNEHTLILAVDK